MQKLGDDEELDDDEELGDEEEIDDDEELDDEEELDEALEKVASKFDILACKYFKSGKSSIARCKHGVPFFILRFGLAPCLLNR